MMIILSSRLFKYHSGTLAQKTQLDILKSIPLLTFFFKSSMNWFQIQLSTLNNNQASTSLYVLSLVIISANSPVCNIYCMVQLSIGFLLNLSSFQVTIPFASHFLILLIISLKTGLQGALALISSSKIETICIQLIFAFQVITSIWSGIDCTCLSSHSEDLRAYKKYFSIGL